MKTSKRICAVLLTGALLALPLAGCSQNGGGGTPAPSGSPAPAVSSTPAPGASATPAPAGNGGTGAVIGGDMAEHIIGIPGDTTIMTVDGQSISAEQYLYWLAYATESMVQQMGGAEIDWDMDLGGVTFGDYLVQNAKSMVTLQGVLRTRAAAAGVTLSAEDQAVIDGELDGIEQQLGGPEELALWLQEVCVSEAGMKEILTASYMSKLLQEALYAPGGEYYLDDDAMVKWAEDNGKVLAKHILLKTTKDDGTAMTDEEKAAVLAEAQGLVDQLRAENDPEPLFDTLMNEKSQDGRDASGKLGAPDGYFFGDGEMVEAFQEGAKALAYGEVSDPVETNYGYHVILRLKPVTQTARDSYAQADMNSRVDQWVSEAVVETEDILDTITAKAFFEKLTEARSALDAQWEAAHPTPEPSATPAAGE